MVIGVDIRELVGKKAGKGWYVYRIMEQWAKKDRNHRYILYTYDDFEAKLPENHQIIKINKKGMGWHWAVAKRLKRDGVEVYFAPTSAIVPSLISSPSVVAIMDMTVFLFPDKHTWKSRLVERLFIKRAVHKAKKVIAISEATKEDLCRFFPEVKYKVEVTPLGVDEVFRPLNDSAVKPVMEKYDLEREYILFVGTLEPRKNIVEIIKAYAGLATNLRQKYPLVITGKKGWFFEEIFNKVKELGLEDAVKFLGYVPEEDLPALYNGAKVFIYPSLYEGFGLPVAEAMACGVPVITSNISSLPEVAGTAGITLNPDNTKGMTQALESLLESKREWYQRQEEGLKQAGKFKWERTADLTLEAIENAKGK